MVQWYIKEMCCEDGRLLELGSLSCPTTAFGIRGVQLLGPAIRKPRYLYHNYVGHCPSSEIDSILTHVTTKLWYN